ncbi:MAG: peptidase T [Vicinamibacterales bacterium]
MSPAPLRPARESVVDRFLRYVRVDTQSAEDSAAKPSTPGQLDLIRMLAAELEALGVDTLRVGPGGILYATLPGTEPDESRVPTIGFIAHVDTSPAVSGRNVTPVVHRDYDGGAVMLPGDPAQVLTPERYPVLATLVGDDLITSDGTTLLGSDDKAGVATIMTLVDTLRQNPDLPRGTVAVAFTTDEEIGRGIDAFDVEGFGAEFAYTVDGDALGEINHETWSARGATVRFEGVSAHPGMAKGLMVNAMYAMADFLLRLPADMRPETTDGRDGFIHPYAGTLDVEASVVKVILRDFDAAALDAKTARVRRDAEAAAARFPGTRMTLEVEDQYRNMDEVLRDHPLLVEFALEAARRAGLSPGTHPIRGGTDGSKLTFRGLPCPNLFTGGANFHSRQEFNSRRGLEKTTETLVHLVQVFAERGGEL